MTTSFQAVLRTPNGSFIKALAPRATVEQATADCAKLAKWTARKPTDVIAVESTDGKTVAVVG